MDFSEEAGGLDCSGDTEGVGCNGGSRLVVWTVVERLVE